MAEVADWKLIEETQKTKHFENGEEYLTLITAPDDKFHIILEDAIIPNDVEKHLFVTKEKVIKILRFDPWN